MTTNRKMVRLVGFTLIGVICLALMPLLGCAPAMQANERDISSHTPCPPAGTKIPARRIITMGEDFVGCDVEVDVQFLAASWGVFTCCDTASPLQGMVKFRFIEPGTEPQMILQQEVGNLAVIPKHASDAIMTVKKGVLLRLRGRVWRCPGYLGARGCEVFIATIATEIAVKR